MRPDLRRAVVYAVVALVGLVVGRELTRDHADLDGYRLAGWACAVLVLAFGVLATRSASGEVSRALTAHAAVPHAAAAPVRLLVQVVGYLLTLLAVLTVLEVDLSQFLVGGALTGVVIGIAAQQSLGNFFAGLVLLLARPYAVGDAVTVYSGAINGPHSGTVTDVGLIYTVLTTETGSMHVPNSVLLASAVGSET